MDAASVTKAWLDAYNARDLNVLSELLTDDFRWSDPDMGSEMDRPTFLEACHRIAEQVPDRRIELHQMIGLNNYAVALSAVWRGTPVVDTLAMGGPMQEAGTELHSGESMVVEAQDGRIRFIRVYRWLLPLPHSDGWLDASRRPV